MKKTILLAAIFLAIISPAFAQTLPAKIVVQDSIVGNVRWTNDQNYLLKGYVYVVNGATLTIDSGVNIFGDKATKGALIVERGAKIFANGTKNYPVVFTSNESAGGRNYGDWGGVILCGKSPTNWTTQDKQVEGGPRSLYGGTDINDNSGKLSYVRIEFGGIAFSPNNEVNSLSLYGVGNATVIDHIQTSYSGDDGFEWFAGSVNASYLVTYKTVDDDFDNDNNYSGKNQFLVAFREPYVGDVSGSKAIESDAYLSGTYSGIPYVAAQANTSVYSNMTLVGPQKTVNSTNHSVIQNIAGVHIRRGSGVSVMNSIILGFPVGVLIDESSATYGSTTANIANGSLQFRNNIIAGNGNSGGPRDILYVKDGARSLTVTTTSADTVTGSPFAPAAGPYTFLSTAGSGNRIVPGDNTGNLNLTDPFNLGVPNLLPLTGSPALSGADFTSPKLAGGFIVPTTYVGAFGTTNWMDTWTEFNPVNKDYTQRRNPAPASGVNNISASVRMFSVYPNPAANNASVTFDVVERSYLTVGMYDITGKLVKQIFNGEKVSGSHAISIDLTGVQSGYYVVRIASAKGQQSASLVVAK